MTTLTLHPGQAKLADLRQIFSDGAVVVLDRACRDRVEASAAVVRKVAVGDEPVYGINTGFGKLAQVRIAPEETEALQRNLILSHAAGIGVPLGESVVRLVLVLKLISLGRGASGVRWEVIEMLEAMLEHGIIPVVPGQGSVGASGDLAPLAHVAAVMIGEGEAFHQGARKPSRHALAAAGLEPLTLGPKEGLALINGTQVSTALAIGALIETHRLFCTALATGALSTDAAMGSAAPFRAEVQELRGLASQIDAAATLRALLDGSEIRESHRQGDERVQDPYCIRCQPQVMGACLQILRQSAETLVIEANAVTDNPLVFPEDGSVVSGGNFHAEPVAFVADQLALAIAEIGSISERRVAMLVDPALSFGLPPFLTPEPGVNSGFMIAEVTAAALYSENKQKAAPCSVDSTPTSANQEDHVSMAAHAARRLIAMNANLAHIIGIELLIAAQGIEFRAPLKTSDTLARVIAAVRGRIPALGEDRYMHPELVQASWLVRTGAVTEAAGADLFPGLEAPA